MSTPDAKTVVEQYLQAFSANDENIAQTLLHPSKFAFRGPIDTFDSAQAYLDSTRQLHHIIERVDILKLVSEGATVFAIYDLVTNSPAGTSHVAQYFVVEAGRIIEMDTFFDARPFAAMFGQ